MKPNWIPISSQLHACVEKTQQLELFPTIVKGATPHLVRLGPLDELHEAGLTYGNLVYPPRKLGVRRIRGDISVFRVQSDIELKAMRASAARMAWYFCSYPHKLPRS